VKDQLLQIRRQLATSLKAVDALIAGLPSDKVDDVLAYRTSPGGMLSAKGVAEMYRRFVEGESDAVIGAAMSISVQGVAKRRGIWRKTLDEYSGPRGTLTEKGDAEVARRIDAGEGDRAIADQMGIALAPVIRHRATKARTGNN
jgi:hypothetical protein